MKLKWSLKFFARWYAWVFGAVLMVALGVVAVLLLLEGHSYSQCVLLIGLFLYFVASLVTFRDDISRLPKK